MRIRGRYHPIRNRIDKGAGFITLSDSDALERFIANIINNWIDYPLWKKCLIKWKSNIAIYFGRSLLRLASDAVSKGHFFDYYHGKISSQTLFFENSVKINRTLPISLTKQDLIQALYDQFKEETGIETVFSKDLTSYLKTKEKEEIVQKNKKELKAQYQYLLDVANKLESNA